MLLSFVLVSPVVAYAQCIEGASSLCNPLRFTSIEGFFSTALSYVGTIVGFLAIIMLVYSGFNMVIARGEPDKLKTAKQGFAWAVGGFVISICSFVILTGYRSLIGINAGYNLSDTTRINNPLSSPDIASFLSGILGRSITIVGGVALLLFVFNAFNYIVSGGNEEKIKKARTGMTWSIIGFVTSLMAYVILAVVRRLIAG